MAYFTEETVVRLSLENALEEKEQELKKTRSTEFKLWFAGRLAWTYIKSVLGFFIPNTLVLVIAGSIIGIVAPNNVPEVWLSTWVSTGWAFLLVFGGFILFIIHEVFEAPLFQWLCLAIIFGIFCSIPYILVASDDPAVLYYGYAAFTFAGAPFIFVFRRTLVIWKDIKSLPSAVASLKQQIRQKEIFEENMKQKGLKPVSCMDGVYWGTPEQVEEYKSLKEMLKNNFAGLSPRQFREFVGELFKRMGYKKITDYGSYLIAERDNEKVRVVADKHSENAIVGNKEVRAVLGTLFGKAQRAIFIVTSDFTEYAYEQARNSPIELWNRNRLAEKVREFFIKPLKMKMQKFKVNGGREV